MLDEFFVGTDRPDRINFSFIKLIPKVVSLKNIGDSRSIALFNTTLKIVSKILENRITPFSRIWLGITKQAL